MPSGQEETRISVEKHHAWADLEDTAFPYFYGKSRLHLWSEQLKQDRGAPTKPLSPLRVPGPLGQKHRC